MFFVEKKWIFFTLSGVLAVLSIVAMIVFGLKTSIEFTGGSVLEVSYDNRPTIETIQQAVQSAGVDESAQVQFFGDDNVLVRTRDITDAERGSLVEALAIDDTTVTEERFNTIGPSIGKELRRKSITAIIAVVIFIILFVAFAFRHVSKPVSSWRYGLIAIVALIHDILVPLGIFVLLGKEINTLVIVGLLSILGLSVNDTIVVFDRIRENLRFNKKDNIQEPFSKTVGKSIRQTMARSINTSLTLIVVLVVLWIVGPLATRDLALILLIGTISGTYSSIALASPLLVAVAGKKQS